MIFDVEGFMDYKEQLNKAYQSYSKRDESSTGQGQTGRECGLQYLLNLLVGLSTRLKNSLFRNLDPLAPEPEQVAADVFMKIESAGEIRDFSRWAAAGVIHAYRDYLASAAQRHSKDTASLDAIVTQPTAENAGVASAELDEIFSGLKGQDRKLLEMCREGLSMKEIAEALGVGINTAKTLKRRLYESVQRKYCDRRNKD